MKVCSSTGMLPLQNLDRKWMFVDGFHRLSGSSSLFHVCGCTLPDQYYCEFLWSWEKFLWRWSTVQLKMRYATVVVKVHAGKTTKWAHALMIGKESLKGWWILTTLKKWTGWAQALFRKVVGDRFYSSSVPKYIYFALDGIEWVIKLWVVMFTKKVHSKGAKTWSVTIISPFLGTHCLIFGCGIHNCICRPSRLPPYGLKSPASIDCPRK